MHITIELTGPWLVPLYQVLITLAWILAIRLGILGAHLVFPILVGILEWWKGRK